MTSSGLEKVHFTNPVQPRRVKKYIYINNTAATPQAKNDIYAGWL
jgi:hypothetical protein